MPCSTTRNSPGTDTTTKPIPGPSSPTGNLNCSIKKSSVAGDMGIYMDNQAKCTMMTTLGEPSLVEEPYDLLTYEPNSVRS